MSDVWEHLKLFPPSLCSFVGVPTALVLILMKSNYAFFFSGLCVLSRPHRVPAVFSPGRIRVLPMTSSCPDFTSTSELDEIVQEDETLRL